MSDIKFPQVSWTLLSFLSDLNIAVIWIVSILLISSFFLKLMGIVPSALTNWYYLDPHLPQPFQFFGNVQVFVCLFTIIIYSFRVFHISVSWWFFTGVWVTASLQDSSQGSGCSQQCCHLDSPYPFANFFFFSLLLWGFFPHKHLLVVFHRSLSNCKSPQDSRILLSMPANLNYADGLHLSSYFQLLLGIYYYYYFVMPPWTSPHLTIFSHQRLKKKKESLDRTYTLLIPYLLTDQILMVPEKIPLNFFFLPFFLKSSNLIFIFLYCCCF